MTRVFAKVVAEVGGSVRLEGDEHRYMTRVKRIRSGGRVEVICKDGRRFAGVVCEVGNGFANIALEEVLPQAPEPWNVRMVVAVPKKNLFDDIVRKLSELGVARLSPLLTERSVLLPGDGRLERWRRIASESRRQCGRRQPIIVDDIVKIDGLNLDHVGAGKRLILSPDAEGRGLFGALHNAQSPITIVVGPEGGFTKPELELANSLGFESVDMGNFVLRVETAAFASACLCIASLDGF